MDWMQEMSGTMLELAIVIFTSLGLSMAGCGGELRGSGNVTSPNYPQDYPNNIFCRWKLISNVNSFVSLRITDFNIEDGFDVLYIYKGNETDKPYYELTGSRYGNGEALLLWSTVTVVFYSDISYSDSGFRMVFTSTNATSYFTGCGGELRESGNIISPNHPNNYPNNSLCTWTLTTTSDRYIWLRLVTLHTESGFDFLRVHYTTAETQTDLAFSGVYSEKNKPIILGSSATVVFTSDSTNSSSGFFMEFGSVEYAPYRACGGELYESGNITSPNYPNDYPNNSRCTWTLTATAGRSISLRLLRFATESKFDIVHFYNGSVATQPYKSYSGIYPEMTKPIILGVSATIVFTSDSTNSSAGFLIEFRSVDLTPYRACGGELSGSGSITSPNYPQNYPDSARCTWEILAADYQYISIRLYDAHTENASDYVYITNRENPIDDFYFHHLTGSFSNFYFPFILGPSVLVVFSSDSSNSDSGFRLEFKSVNFTRPEACGEELKGSGYVTLPYIPHYDPSQRRCTWKITADVDRILLLRLITLRTSEGLEFVHIYNGTDPTQMQIPYKYTGVYNKNEKPLLLGPSCTIVFTSKLIASSPKFQLQFESVVSNLYSDCGSELNEEGHITSRNLSEYYPYQSRCTWKLTATTDRIIFLLITELNLTLGYDYLYVLNGTEILEQYLLHNYTGRSKDNIKLFLPGPSATLLFTGDLARPETRFDIKFESLVFNLYTACGGELNGSGEITSPNYPNHYPNNSRCSWRLRASNGLSIALQIISVRKEANYDTVKVYSVTGQNEVYKEVLSDIPANSRQSTKPIILGSNAAVVFTSDGTISDSGFQIHFSSINTTSFTACGGRLYGSGNITSPNYPNQYPNSCHCTWYLKATPGRIVSVRLVEYNIENGYDFIHVFDSPREEWGYSWIFTGSSSFFDKRKTLELVPDSTVTFISDISNSASGFQIEFESVNATKFTGCGGHLYGSGEIVSPNYPNDYPNRSLCTWKLTAEAGGIVALRLLEFNTVRSGDIFNIYNGTGVRLVRTQWYAGSYNETLKLLVRGPYVTLVFESDSTLSASGFRILFQSADMTPYTDCGGELHGSGNITSPHYPANYPNNSRCTWILRAVDGSVVSLQLIEFNTESAYDSVNVYNGSQRTEKNSSYIFTGHYAEGKHSVILGTTATIVFTSDSTDSASGFRLEFRSVDPISLIEVARTTTAKPAGMTSKRCSKARRSATTLPLPNTSDKK